jgi:hypothetical protein
MRFELKLVYTSSCCDAMLLSLQSKEAAGYNLCELPSYVMERELLHRTIRLIRKAIPNAPSHCCTGQALVASDAAAVCCIELLG